MRIAALAASLAVLAVSAEQPSTPPVEGASVEGIVTNSVSGEPLRKAILLLTQMQRPGGSWSGTTDAAGHFAIYGLDPGRYRLSAERSGFVKQEYDSPLILSAGEKLKDVSFKLAPQGVVLGRIVDEDGDPVMNVRVECQRYEYQPGERRLVTAAESSTNDLGEYRIFGLEPGRYYISAMQPAYLASYPPGSNGVSEEALAPVYYPSAKDVSAASPLVIEPGAQIAGVDITMMRTRTVHVRGRLIYPDHSVKNVPLFLTPRDSGFANASARAFGRTAADGKFDIAGVVPGPYTLVAESRDDGVRTTARLPVDVSSSGLEGVLISLAPGMEISGVVVYEGAGKPSVNSSARIVLTPRKAGAFATRAYSSLRDDNRFTLTGVAADEYIVDVTGLPVDAYLKSVRFGNADVTGGLDLTHGVAADELQLTVSLRGAMVEGVVRSANDEPASGVAVVLIPDAARRTVPSLFKIARTDLNGHFQIRGIAPGDYKLFAWEKMKYGAWQDPDFLKPYEDMGISLTLKESSHESMGVKTIVP